MGSLNFDEGYKEYDINGDKSRVIRFNPSDLGMINRIKDAYNDIDKAAEKSGDIELDSNGDAISNLNGEAERLEVFKAEICKAIDGIFNSNICEIAFGNQNPLSPVGNGMPLWESFLRSVLKEVEKETGARMELSRKKIQKYKNQVYRK